MKTDKAQINTTKYDINVLTFGQCIHITIIFSWESLQYLFEKWHIESSNPDTELQLLLKHLITA